MPILASFVLPHPPIIIPEIGKGEEEKIVLTFTSLNKVGEAIALLKPDLIILSSPHMEGYRDYFSVSSRLHQEGDLSSFGAPDVSFRLSGDEEFVNAFNVEAHKIGFPAGNETEMTSLDHGTMVPLYFVNRHYQNYHLVRLALSGLSLPQHYEMGQLIQKTVDRLGRKAIFIASGDLSHCQKETGPYGYRPEGPKYDEQIMDVLAKGHFGDLFDFDPQFLAKAETCGHDSFIMMAGALDGLKVKPVLLSHEATFGVGYGVCEYFVEGKDLKRRFLSQYLKREKEKVEKEMIKADPYVLFAKECLVNYFSFSRPISDLTAIPRVLLDSRAGVFVSLHEFGRLRGCIGTIKPTKNSIGEEIATNAVDAAVGDPRFDPVAKEDLAYLSISVDVLSESEPISSKKDLNPKIYGVIVEKGSRRGLLLPNLDGVDTVDDQIAIAKEKAGIAIEDEVVLHRFKVVRHV